MTTTDRDEAPVIGSDVRPIAALLQRGLVTMERAERKYGLVFPFGQHAEDFPLTW